MRACRSLGKTTWRFLNPYGERINGIGVWATDRGMLDIPADPGTGYVQTGARLYDPAVGRFLSVDPLLDPGQSQTLNGYSYTGGDPINTHDASGMFVPRFNTIPETGNAGPTPTKRKVSGGMGRSQASGSLGSTTKASSTGQHRGSGGKAAKAGSGSGGTGASSWGPDARAKLKEEMQPTWEDFVLIAGGAGLNLIPTVPTQIAGTTIRTVRILYRTVAIASATLDVYREKVAKATDDEDENYEIYFRGITWEHYNTLVSTGRLPAGTRETVISPSLTYAKKYNDVRVGFVVEAGTTAKLTAIGERDDSPITKNLYPWMPPVRKRWKDRGAAFFKGETVRITGESIIDIGLGEKGALDVFSDNLVYFKRMD